MIDYQKTFIPDYCASNLEEKFERLQTYNIDTNEPCGLVHGFLGNLELKKVSTGYILKNSIHTYRNDSILKNNLANTNDFDYHKLIQTIDYISNLLDIDFSETNLQVLEFGLNLQFDNKVTHLINKISSHKSDYPVEIDNNKRHSKEFKHSDYRIKIYDKGKQFKLDNNVLRIELNMYSREFKKCNVKNLNDLKNKAYLKALFNLLIKRFDELTIIDTSIASKSLNHKDALLFASGQNLNYWNELNSVVSRNSVYKKKRRYYQIIEECNLETTKKELREVLVTKFNQLIN